jgi:putative restriction endonuclease
VGSGHGSRRRPQLRFHVTANLPLSGRVLARALSGEGGEHDITNGLLLRTDIHRLFDLGYVTVSNAGRFEVGQRLKEDFENGRHYYDMRGQPLLMPQKPNQRPGREFLELHQTNKFLG